MRDALRTALRFLTFRATREELAAVDGRHFALGLLFTWLAGVGRYWDNPHARLIQSTGLVSLLLVFVLALLLWLLILPLRPSDWSYERVLIFVMLTAPLAWIYAIPVERWFSMNDARGINVWFLAIVATWRVGLFALILARYAQLRWLECIAATLLPLTFIASALAALNLEHAVFSIMAGLTEHTPADSAYTVLIVLTYLSSYAFEPLLVLYVISILRARKRVQAPPATVTDGESEST